MHFSGKAQGKYLGFLVPNGESNHPLTEHVPCAVSFSDQSTADASIAVRGLFTDDDGELFGMMLRQLEQIASTYMPLELQPSSPLQAENIFMLFYKDGRIDIWINETRLRANTRVRRDVSAGELARLGDIADIESVQLVGIEIPEKCAFASFMSLNGARCLVFDLRPCQEDWDDSIWDPVALLSASLTFVLFQHQLSLKEIEWKEMTEQSWFPFICLDVETIGAMIRTMRANSPIDDCLPRIANNVRSLLPNIERYFLDHAVFDRHRAVIVQALQAYERRDYAIASTALLARTEGLLRDYYARENVLRKPSQRDYLNAIAKRLTRNPLSLLRPQRFAAYLESVIFDYENFANPASVTKVTRHSSGHGVADARLLDEKFATIALLCVYQLGILTSSG